MMLTSDFSAEKRRCGGGYVATLFLSYVYVYVYVCECREPQVPLPPGPLRCCVATHFSFSSLNSDFLLPRCVFGFM